jgi:ketosteroid isomerase-like protein
MTATTDNPGRTAHLLALMKQGDDAFNSQNVAAMNAVHHPDMTAHIPGSAEPIRGRDAHAAAMGQFFQTFPDVHVHNEPYPVQFGSGDWITVVSRTTGTFTGKMTMPDGTVVPPTGKAFDLDFSQTVKWDGDQITEILAFWDTTPQAQQIGLA